MGKTTIYISMSLDGYIAKENGDISWIAGHEDRETESNYDEFIKDIDVVIMGNTTYTQIVKELAVNDWPYKGKESYIYTNNINREDSNVIFTNTSMEKLINKLKEENKNIWILGGGNLINQIIKEDLVDIYYITIIPIILGKGIKLFDINKEIKLYLEKIEEFNGMVSLKYKKR